jgi:ribosomal protein S18 acetylase RimI-like enzyme
MRIDYAAPKDIPALTRLWQDCFGDSEAFIRLFFDTAYAPERCRCVFEEDTPAAALYWFDVYCRGQKMAYIYAVATDPAHRGKGLCRALMADTHNHLALRGYRAVLLVPQSDSLRQMYTKMGYIPCTEIREFCCAAGPEAVQLHRIDRDAYTALRREYLPQGSAVQEEENIAFLETMAFFYRGPHVLLAARTEGQKLYSQEILGDLTAAPGILAAMGCSQGTFRTPGTGTPFAMYLPLHPNAAKPTYFGLAFD